MQANKTKKQKLSRSAKIIAFLLFTPWTLVGIASAYMLAPDIVPSVAEESESNEAVVIQEDFQTDIPVSGENELTVSIHFFAQDKCGYCRAERKFLEEYLVSESNARLVYYNVAKNKEHWQLFDRLAQANGLPRVTPYTFVGGEIIRGFGGEETTGTQIKEAVAYARDGHNHHIEDYLNPEDIAKDNSNNTEQATSSEEVLFDGHSKIEMPIIGEINLKNFSLFSLSAILGLIDGFNPCALWVLMAFLLILMQIGNRRKMFYVAGLFIFAESVMYYLILSVWYNTWNFIGLDNIVTPLIGVFAMGCGIYFLYKYNKTKNKFTCDVTSIEKQSKIQKKIHKLVSSPMTVATAIGIVGVAFSVNVIEFACSIGIPQTFTGILELNALPFWTQQWYVLVYIFTYMVDDFIVFGFALYGFDKLHTSQKYSKLSMLVGGILMILLGGLLLFFPDALVF